MPLLPRVGLELEKAFDNTKGYKYQSELALKNANELNIDTTSLKPKPIGNVLVIPQIGVDGMILEGEVYRTLDTGIWRRPNTSTPDKGGNTVISAHRYMYTTGPKTFYNLDKMKLNDEFIIFWEGKEYNYKVFEVLEVEPTQIEIEYNTDEPIVTLYTCTPLWTSSRRLVVKAALINSPPDTNLSSIYE